MSIEGADSYAFSDSKARVFQPRPIHIQSIGTLRNKPVLPYMGPFSKGYTIKMTSSNGSSNLVMQEMRNKTPERPRHPFMGRAELLDEIPVPAFPAAPAPNALNPSLQTNRSA